MPMTQEAAQLDIPDILTSCYPDRTLLLSLLGPPLHQLLRRRLLLLLGSTLGHASLQLVQQELPSLLVQLVLLGAMHLLLASVLLQDEP